VAAEPTTLSRHIQARPSQERSLISALLIVLGGLDSSVVRDVRVAPTEVLRTTSAGSGPALVLIPSLFGSAFGYRRLIEPLTRRGYRVVVVEPLGTGFSSYPKQADYSLTAQADRLARALDTLGVAHALVIGQAVGASIALRLAYRHPAQVRALIVIDGGPIETAATQGLQRVMRSAPLLELLLSPAGLRRQVRHYLLENSGDTTWVTPEVVRGYTAGAERNLAETLDAWRGMVNAVEPELLRDHLASIHIPVRLLVGSVPHPSAVQPVEVAELQQTLPRFTVDSIAGSAQFVAEEQPESVVQAVADMEHLAQ